MKEAFAAAVSKIAIGTCVLVAVLNAANVYQVPVADLLQAVQKGGV